jgi:ketosteroid isomerase-like protein
MWFTENPWPPMILLALAACVAFGLWMTGRKAKYLALALVMALAMPGVYFVEQAIVTDAETIEADVERLVAAFQRKDLEATLGFFSKQAVGWRNTVTLALTMVTVEDDVSVKDLDVTMFAQNSRADSHFRANGRVSFQGSAPSFQPSRWILTWQKEDGAWKIIEVQRLNPIKDEKLQIFEAKSL